MQLLPIVLIGVLLVADGGLGLAAADLGLGRWRVFGLVWVPVLLVLAVTFGGMRVYRRRLADSGAPGAIFGAERLARSARVVLLAHFALVVLVFGWLDTVRGVVGDVVLLDELLTIAPPLAGVVATWWLYYPIERSVRDAQLIRRLDLGKAIFPTPTRGQYVLGQARLHLLLLLAPVLMILTAAELIDFALVRGELARWIGDVLTLLAAVGIVLLAPVLARFVLDAEAMAAGALRDELLGVCRTHRVRIRALLIWRTYGTMINAAVMGLIGPLRYVLLTDALLESMSRREVVAVMAHEIGHIRRRHLPWLLASLLATIAVMTAPLLAASLALDGWTASDARSPWGRLATTAVAVSAAAAVLTVFGWISRRFERQADSFAVVHLSRDDGSDAAAPGLIGAEAVAVMCGALESIARLNAVPATRPSWRHGSIAWRRAYLESLVGKPAETLPIDRQVRWIKGLAALVLGFVVLSAGLEAACMMERPEPDRTPVQPVDDDSWVWDDVRQWCTSPTTNRRKPLPG